ncbi:MAG: winged helix DNA-binding domain-containing protein [Promethearchaeota archaeon]
MRNLKVAQVNSYLLEKHYLKEQNKSNNILQIVKDICGLHATGTLEPYLTLFTRMKDFKKEDLDNELYKKKSLGRIRGMRKTLFILTKEMIPIVHSMIKHQTVKRDNKYLELRDISRDQYNELAQKIINLLAKKEMSTSEIKASIDTEKDLNAVISIMLDEMFIIRGKPISSWRDRRVFYAPFSQYFPDIELDKIDESKATRMLIDKYIKSYGPVTEMDIAWWLGLTIGKIRTSLKPLTDKITIINIGDLGHEYLMYKSDMKLLQEIEISPRYIVNLLPKFDPYLMGYKDRERYINYDYYNYIFDRSGNATSTILFDGYVIGVWDVMEKPKPSIKIHLFVEMGSNVLSMIESECKKMGKFITGNDVEIIHCDKMTPLTKKKMGGFMAPLKDC